MLLLLHGFCESHEIFRNLWPHLTAKRRVIAPDLPGHGGTPWDPKLKSINDAADWVIEFMDRLGIAEFDLLGHSMGGYIAASIAAKHPQRLKKLWLLHSTTLSDTPEKIQSRNKVIQFVLKNGTQPFLKPFVRSLFATPKESWTTELDRITAQVDKEALLAFLAAMRDRPSTLEALSKGKTKATYILGELDTIVPTNRNAEEIAQWPAAETITFPDAGHMAMYEAPEKLLDVLGK